MPERKLATIEKIAAIDPILGADAIEAATVRGWKVVVKKGEFAPGDPVIYCEIDSALPLERPAFEFLRARGVKTIDVDGHPREVHVLRTVKLRGQVSQGLVISAESERNAIFFALIEAGLTKNPNFDPSDYIGLDMTESLGIVKYDPPIPAELSGLTRGKFPTGLLSKTDAERVQNLGAVFENLARANWYPSEKVDGTSVTALNTGGELRVCSRNWELKWDDNLTQVKVLTDNDLLPEPGWGIQFELVGPGIQANRLKLSKPRAVIFGVYREGDDHRFHPVPRLQWPAQFEAFGAPVLDLPFPGSVEAAVAQVDGLKSVLNPQVLAEGVVWHTADGSVFDELDGRECFKSINNRYLLKNGE